MSRPYPHLHRLAWIAVLLALIVIVFGAFVRLSNAGLSCPDWPTCYGQATWPTQDHEVDQANAAFERPVESHKTWREQVHRHLAATLGLLVLAIAALAARTRRFGVATVASAAVLVAASIPLYMLQRYGVSSALAGAGLAVLLAAAWRWSNDDFSRVGALTFAMIVVQALLGMWTVTWLLKPVVVMAHLLGGLTTFALLTWTAGRAAPNAPLVLPAQTVTRTRRLLRIGIALVAIQIALGGWVSANYAALACGTDFPDCFGQWWPETNFREAFVLWRGIGVDYEGGVLDWPARTAIHLTHRLFAFVVVLYLIALALRLRRDPLLSGHGTLIGVLVAVQFLLGVFNVVTGLPLKAAVMHNLGAALLLFSLVLPLSRLRSAARPG